MGLTLPDATGVGLLVLDVMGWVIMLGGVAATTATGYSSRQLGLWWWALWFQFVTLLLIIVLAITSASTAAGWAQLRRDFLVMVTVLLMVVTHSAVLLSDTNDSSLHNGARCTVAGTIICTIVNFGLLGYFALDMNSSAWKAGPPSAPTKAGATATVGASPPGGARHDPARLLPFPSVSIS